MLRVATVFSGIGAAEHALSRSGVETQIAFACDNGERYLKPTDKDLLAKMEAETDPLKKEELSLLLAEKTKSDIEAKLPPKSDPIARETAVRELYDATKRINYVEESYKKNYEIDPSCWFQDVRFLDGTRFAGKVDLFIGGSPCQSFSTYGKKGGLGDARGTLFFEYARLVQEIQPTAFIYENVRGLKIHKGGKTWEKMKEIFESLNYDIKEAILDAVDYGLPQMRKRMFVVGIRRDVNHSEYTFPKKKKLTKHVEDYLEEEVPDEYYLPIKGFKWVTETERNDNKARCNRSIMGCQTAVQQINWSGDFRIETPKPSHRANEKIYIGEWKDMKEAVARKLTPRECMALMGFKDFKIEVPDRVAYRQAGNSIAVPVIKAVIKSIFDAVPSLKEKSECQGKRGGKGA